MGANGTYYFSDTLLHAVFSVDSINQMIRIAGNGVPGFSGDGSAAINAQLNSPRGVAVDANGNVFLSIGPWVHGGWAYTDGRHLGSVDFASDTAAFYREHLKKLSAGKQFMDMSGGDGGAVLSLADEKSQGVLQVHVAKAEKGSDIQLVANRKAAK